MSSPADYDPNWKPDSSESAQKVDRSTKWYDMIDSQGGFSGRLTNVSEDDLAGVRKAYEGNVKLNEPAAYSQNQPDPLLPPDAKQTAPMKEQRPITDITNSPAPVSSNIPAMSTSGPSTALTDSILPGKTAEAGTETSFAATSSVEKPNSGLAPPPVAAGATVETITTATDVEGVSTGQPAKAIR